MALYNTGDQYATSQKLYFCLLKVYKQKVKHLLYEHQNNITELKAESTVALSLAQDDNRKNELNLRKDKRSLKVELKEQELSHEDVIKDLKKVNFEQFCNKKYLGVLAVYMCGQKLFVTYTTLL